MGPVPADGFAGRACTRYKTPPTVGGLLVVVVVVVVVVVLPSLSFLLLMVVMVVLVVVVLLVLLVVWVVVVLIVVMVVMVVVVVAVLMLMVVMVMVVMVGRGVDEVVGGGAAGSGVVRSYSRRLLFDSGWSCCCRRFVSQNTAVWSLPKKAEMARKLKCSYYGEP